MWSKVRTNGWRAQTLKNVIKRVKKNVVTPSAVAVAVVSVEVSLTAGGQSLGAVGQSDDVSVSFQDEDLILTTRH